MNDYNSSSFNSPPSSPQMEAGAAAHDIRGNKALSVSELNRQVKRLLEVSYQQVWVKGELSGFSRPGSGHWYFSLKDERAQIRCAMFRGYNQRLKFQPKEGDEIIVRGKVSLYEGRGDFQLIAEDIEPAGLGKLQAAFEALKLRLSQEGLFDQKHKRALPKLPTKLAVVTSETGAVIHDVIQVCRKRFPALPITLVPVRVQGEGSAQEIADAIRLVNEQRLADVMIVGRGGGSLEDLWAFNEEIVARAIYGSQIPIISAVGHEVDFTIADLVADYRAPTPSAGAEAITPDQYELMQSLDLTQNRLSQHLLQTLSRKNEQLRLLARGLKSPSQTLEEKRLRILELRQRVLHFIQQELRFTRQTLNNQWLALNQHRPEKQFEQLSEKLNALQERLKQSQTQQLNSQQHRLQLAAQTLHTASPLATLGRGYAIALDKSRQVIKSPSQVTSGDAITVKVEQGDIDCQVK